MLKIVPYFGLKWSWHQKGLFKKKVSTGVAPSCPSLNIKILSLDMAKFLAYILAMKTANIGDLKNNLSKFINFVEQGEVIEICKRNIPIALLVPHGIKKTPNRTQLGCGVGTVQVKGDLTEPLIPDDSWEMLR
jgi:prevent-host-death family protein